jgi:hypothetical protein
MGWFNYRPFEKTRKNKVLGQGVLSVDSETGKVKVGDNHTLWNDLDELGGGGSVVSELYIASFGVQVLINGNNNTLGPFEVDTSRDGVGEEGVTFSGNAITFVEDAVKTVTMYVQANPGSDGGALTQGIIQMASSGDFTDPYAPLGLWDTIWRATLTIRRGFGAGEVITPKANLRGVDNTKHAGLDTFLWVTD